MSIATHSAGPVHYGRAGSGPGLVLVHGTGGDAQTNWAHLVPGFTDIRTVITPDYAGSGQTADPGGELTLDLLAGQVAAYGPLMAFSPEHESEELLAGEPPRGTVRQIELDFRIDLRNTHADGWCYGYAR
ncbi:alpha/beta fold hydrolase [Nonomuraea polychroma]|uniref:alpha/beta fold hydrolase n=1 Tax=Nonomuraea polychroma TaxID=46176 RepID=UPI003D8FACA9